MSRARHRASGGSANSQYGDKKVEWNAQGSEAMKEAKELKKGGKAMGEKSKARADRPSRARGGRMRGAGVGADTSPLTTASKVKHVTPGEVGEHGEDKVY